MIYKRKQFGDKDFRRRFSKINGIKIIPHPNLSGDWDRYTPSNWWWSINPDLVNFIEVKQCFESLTSEECDEYQEEINFWLDLAHEYGNNFDMKKFIQNISSDISVQRTSYTITGDIISGFLGKDAKIYTFINQHDIYRTIQFLATPATKNYPELDINEDYSITATGYIEINRYAKVQFVAENIEILGKCSREQEYEKSAEMCKDIFAALESQHKIELSLRQGDYIGIITGGSKEHPCRGYGDFKKKTIWQSVRKKDLHPKTFFININDIDEIVQSIEKFNSYSPPNRCRMLFIIRGGGDPEDLCRYSSPKLVKAIYDSEIPVITGIGHCDDELLCNLVAAKDCGTPTGVANFLNSLTQSSTRRFVNKVITKFGF